MAVSIKHIFFILTLIAIPMSAKEKVRGAWVASVANTDWPSKQGLSIPQQQKECRDLLDLAVQLNLNTIIFQVRPHGDALYKSSFEPWSDRLTGTQGKDPGYDPLAYWIKECRKRKLKLHAWFNPYRVKHPSVKGPISPKSIMKKAPQWCLPLKKNYIWLDPSNPKVRQYVQGVILDCVRKYDVDGVHLDDYFYPYKDFLPTGGFPDFYKYKKYVKTNPQSPMTRSAWRRHNVNTLIYSLHVNLKKLKPHVEFGISPFGIWRPGFPKQIKGTSAFDDLACDSRKWLVEGWVDYLSPQLYWPESAKQQQFSILLKWWCAQNPKNKQVIPGLASWRTDPKELLRQMKMSNDYSKSAGFLHFSLGAIQKNQSLKSELIKYRSLR